MKLIELTELVISKKNPSILDHLKLFDNDYKVYTYKGVLFGSNIINGIDNNLFFPFDDLNFSILPTRIYYETKYNNITT